MSEEQEKLIGIVYKLYVDSHTILGDPNGKTLGEMLCSVIPMEHSQESFTNKCKTNTEFSKKWGLKIEERELSRDERYKWYKANTHLIPSHFRNQAKEFEDKYVPTKLITMTYNDKIIESYE
jgi:hypothetical protein